MRARATHGAAHAFPVFTLFAASAALILAACSSGDGELASSAEAKGSAADGTAEIAADAAAPADAGALGSGPYLRFNQQWIEGLSSDGVDLRDVDAVFVQVFSSLPDEVTVYPSENYYYFILAAEGRQIWGNIRLPAGRREHGGLSFGYFEFIEFPGTTGAGFSGSKFFTDADGVIVTEVDPVTYTVRFDRKTVTFRFHELDQTPPASLPLGESERFIQRTFDESGYQFALVFNEEDNYFFWILNEAEPLHDVLDAAGDDLVIGRRSGFAFWIDRQHGDRKVLAGVRRLNVQRNDYYDGPFDQLADNYAGERRVADYMQLAFPGLKGRIDKYGYYTDRERPLRVAISAYLVYTAQADVIAFVEQLAQHGDPLAHISRGGRAEQQRPSTAAPPDAGAAAAGAAQSTGSRRRGADTPARPHRPRDLHSGTRGPSPAVLVSPTAHSRLSALRTARRALQHAPSVRSMLGVR